VSGLGDLSDTRPRSLFDSKSLCFDPERSGPDHTDRVVLLILSACDTVDPETSLSSLVSFVVHTVRYAITADAESALDDAIDAVRRAVDDGRTRDRGSYEQGLVVLSAAKRALARL